MSVCLPLRLRGLDRLQEGHSLSICLRNSTATYCSHVVVFSGRWPGTQLAIAISIAGWIGPLTDGDGIDDSGLISPERAPSLRRSLFALTTLLRSRPPYCAPPAGRVRTEQYHGPEKHQKGMTGFWRSDPRPNGRTAAEKLRRVGASAGSQVGLVPLSCNKQRPNRVRRWALAGTGTRDDSVDT